MIKQILKVKNLSRVLPLFFILCIISNHASADCIGSPSLFVGESATYQYTDAEAKTTDITVKVLSAEKYWQVLQVTDNGTQYKATVETSCLDTGFPSDYEAPEYPSYFEFSRLVELVLPTTYPFSLNQWQLNGQFDFPTCEQDTVAYASPLFRTLQIERCTVNSSSNVPIEDVIGAQTEYISRHSKAPLGGLINKTLYLSNNRTRSIRLIGIGEPAQLDGSPQPPLGLNALIYSDTALELTWQRPEDLRAVAFEVQRDNDVIGVFDALSYYEDLDTGPYKPRYSVTAIDAQGNRSNTVNIVPRVFNYGFTADYNPPAPVIPTVQNFFAKIYSSTAAEIFWQPGQSNTQFRYEVKRNGVVLGIVDATSYFDDTLQAGDQYIYELTGIAENGARSSTVLTEITTPNPFGSAISPDPEFNLIFPVRHEVYSSTAAELFWDYGYGGIGQRYEIYQNDVLLAETDGNSFFINNLSAGSEYRYQVYSFGFNGKLKAVSETVKLVTRSF